MSTFPSTPTRPRLLIADDDPVVRSVLGMSLGGGMSLADVVRLTIYTTDVDALFPHYGILAERLARAGVMPPATLLGVARLTFPELLVEIDATALQ